MGLCLCGEGHETKRPPGRGGQGGFSPSPFSPCGAGWEEACLHGRIFGGWLFVEVSSTAAERALEGLQQK